MPGEMRLQDPPSALMKIGGYVLHDNNLDTLAPYLDSLLAVCDEVIAIDSNSPDCQPSSEVWYVLIPIDDWQPFHSQERSVCPACASASKGGLS